MKISIKKKQKNLQGSNHLSTEARATVRIAKSMNKRRRSKTQSQIRQLRKEHLLQRGSSARERLILKKKSLLQKSKVPKLKREEANNYYFY